MKGIILAGGQGTRLYPCTKNVNKQLLPVYDKPQIYYSLNVLILAGIKEILVISNPEYIELYEQLLGDGSQLGIKIDYAVQEAPRGLPEAFLIGESFIGDDDVTLILGDNLLHGNGMTSSLTNAIKNNTGCTIFGTRVKDPRRFGVVDFDKATGEVYSIEEKPNNPKSNYAIIGLYIFDSSVVSKAKRLKPSSRGELEIVDLQRMYLNENKLSLVNLYRGTIWLDTGTKDSLVEASTFIQIIQRSKGQYVGCIEETSYEVGNINLKELKLLTDEMPKSDYKEYLERFIEDERS